MFELTVKVTLNNSNVVSHSEIKIVDLETKKSYVVSFSDLHSTFGTDNPRKIQEFDEHEMGCCQPGRSGFI